MPKLSDVTKIKRLIRDGDNAETISKKLGIDLSFVKDYFPKKKRAKKVAEPTDE